MKKFFPIVIALYLISFFPYQIVFAAEISKQDLINNLQNNYDNMSSLTFDFFQRSGGELTGEIKTGNGKANLLKAGKNSYMRWDYFTPDRQVLVSDGKEFSMYFATQNQMIITPASNLESDITYGIFTGKSKLNDDFLAEFIAEEQQSDIEDNIIGILKLTPKKAQSQIQNVHIWISADYLIKRIQIRDHFNSVTTIVLSNITQDDIDTSSDSLNLFNFTPPMGTEIIRQ